MSMRGAEDGTDLEAKVVLPSRKDHSIRKPDILGNLNVAGNNDPASHPKDGHARESKKQNNSDFGYHDVPSDTSKHVNANLLFVCAFCHSSRESESWKSATGGSSGPSSKEEGWNRYNRQMQEEYEEMETVK